MSGSISRPKAAKWQVLVDIKAKAPGKDPSGKEIQDNAEVNETVLDLQAWDVQQPRLDLEPVHGSFS